MASNPLLDVLSTMNDLRTERALLQLARAVSGLTHAVGRLADAQRPRDPHDPAAAEFDAIVEVLIRAQADLDKAIATLADG